MPLTKEDLQAIESLLDSKLESKLDSKLDSKLAPIYKRFEQIDKQLDTLQSNVSTLKGDVAALKADMAHHNHTVEPQLKIIREGLEGWSERAQQIDRHENKLEDHGSRILALEYAYQVK